jgi:uncharacterized protein YbjT (DUF2867 family)
MVVFLTGATGFIGQRLLKALRDAGHEVICAVRHPTPELQALATRIAEVDFTRDHNPKVWVSRLVGAQAVINTVGIIRERGEQTFEAVHVRAPQALFEACALAGVRRVIQLSAAGADDQARSGYHVSKRRADESLAQMPLDWTIVRPSLVFGPGGTSAQLFTGLASLPLIPVPGRGEQLVQPIHIDDVIAALIALLDDRRSARTVIPFVGPAPITFRAMLSAIRSGLKLARPRFIPVPLWIMRIGAKLGRFMRNSLLDEDTLAMLTRGNTGDPAQITQLLGRSPRAVNEFIPVEESIPLRTSAQLWWLLPLLRWSIAVVGIFTALVSFGLYPTQASYELLARVGTPPALQPLFLYGAALLDLVFGIGTLVMRNRVWLWRAQIAVIVGYTLIITARMPEFWLHPYGPLLKNLPMLAAILLVSRLERR